MTTISENIDFSEFPGKMADYVVASGLGNVIANAWIPVWAAIVAFRKLTEWIKVKSAPLMRQACASKTALSDRIEDYVAQSKKEANLRVAHFSQTVPVGLVEACSTIARLALSFSSIFLAFVTVFLGRSMDCAATSITNLRTRLVTLTDTVPLSWLTPYLSSCSLLSAERLAVPKSKRIS